jgi:hypothetical protein
MAEWTPDAKEACEMTEKKPRGVLLGEGRDTMDPELFQAMLPVWGDKPEWLSLEHIASRIGAPLADAQHVISHALRNGHIRSRAFDKTLPPRRRGQTGRSTRRTEYQLKPGAKAGGIAPFMEAVMVEVDRAVRELERRVAGGDPGAVEALIRAYQRAGRITPPLELLDRSQRAVGDAIDAMDPDIRTETGRLGQWGLVVTSEDSQVRKPRTAYQDKAQYFWGSTYARQERGDLGFTVTYFLATPRTQALSGGRAPNVLLHVEPLGGSTGHLDHIEGGYTVFMEFRTQLKRAFQKEFGGRSGSGGADGGATTLQLAGATHGFNDLKNYGRPRNGWSVRMERLLGGAR